MGAQTPGFRDKSSGARRVVALACFVVLAFFVEAASGEPSSRQVYCFGDPNYGSGGWFSDTSSNGSVRQGHAPTLAQRVAYDGAVDVMKALGCQTVKAEIQSQDPDANGGTANQRAQLYMSDGNLAKYGNQPSLDAKPGKTSWYGFAFRTNPGYVPYYHRLFGTFNSIFSWHDAPIDGQWAPLAPIMLEVTTIAPEGKRRRIASVCKRRGKLVRLAKPHLHIQINGGNAASPNWPREDGTFTCRRYLGPEFKPGRKYRVEMRVTWDAYMKGSVQIWIDGKKYVDQTAISNVWYRGSTVDYGMYAAFENYRAYDASLPTNIVYYGGLVKGATRSEVAVP